MNAIGDLFAPAFPLLSKWISSYDDVQRALWRLRALEMPKRAFIGSLRGDKMRERNGVFGQFGALFQFPTYFGENWNAFRDCIADLDWLRADAFLLVVLDAEQLLVDGDPDELSLLLEILREAAESMSQQTSFGPPRQLRALLHATPPHAAALADRLRGLPIRIADAEIPG